MILVRQCNAEGCKEFISIASARVYTIASIDLNPQYLCYDEKYDNGLPVARLPDFIYWAIEYSLSTGQCAQGFYTIFPVKLLSDSGEVIWDYMGLPGKINNL